jgi:DNA-directed RNA polymerase subunit RPC12/RpoP
MQLQKPVYPRGVVYCRKCGAPIYVYKLRAIRDEFAVRCTRCGERGVYLKRELLIEELPERRKKPRNER